MAKINLDIASHCRMMNVCGITMIGNPATGTIIGLDSEGLSLVDKIQLHEDIDTSCLSDNQAMLVNELSANGFFSAQEHINYVSKSYLHVTSH